MRHVRVLKFSGSRVPRSYASTVRVRDSRVPEP
jgi:hypothetical protein